MEKQVDGAISLEQQLGKISLGSLEQRLGKVSKGRVTVGPLEQQLGKIPMEPLESPKWEDGETSKAPTFDHFQYRSKSLEETKHTRVITEQPHHRSKSLEHPTTTQRRPPLQQPPPPRKVTPEEQKLLQQQAQQRRQQRGRSMSLTSLTFVKMRKLFTFRRRTRSLRVRPTVRKLVIRQTFLGIFAQLLIIA